MKTKEGKRKAAADLIENKRGPKDQLKWLNDKGYTATKERAKIDKRLKAAKPEEKKDDK